MPGDYVSATSFNAAMVIIVALVVPCTQAAWPDAVSWTSSKSATSSKISAPKQALGPEQVHSWRITNTAKCRGPLVVEFWEDRNTAAAARPLVPDGLRVVYSDMEFYSILWEDNTKYDWWDWEASAWQLPYHRFFVDSVVASSAEPSSWVHVINKRSTAVPKYQIRTTCQERIPCPEPLLGKGACSGAGACVRSVTYDPADRPGYDPEIGAFNLDLLYREAPTCKCKAGRGGIGCEVVVPSLPLDKVTRLVPVYKPDMKLVWSSALNTNWSLYRLQVPKSIKDLVLEMEVDWSAVNDPSVPLSSISQPRLCISTPEAFKGGRLLVRKMNCVSPLTFPLEWRTGITEHGATVAGMDALVLVMNIGSYPVHLTARTSTVESDYGVSCPFQCSGAQATYSWAASTCWDQGQCYCRRVYGGSACQYKNISTTTGSCLSTYATTLQSVKSEATTLSPGESAWWVASARLDQADRWNVSLGSGLNAWQMEDVHLSIRAFQMKAAGAGQCSHVPHKLCWVSNWTMVQGASSDDDACFQPPVKEGQYSLAIGLFIQNTGAVTIPDFHVILRGLAARSSHSRRGTNIGIALGIGLPGMMLICGSIWYQAGCKGPRQGTASGAAGGAGGDVERAAGVATTGATVPPAGQTSVRRGVPEEVISSFPTHTFGPAKVVPISSFAIHVVTPDAIMTDQAPPVKPTDAARASAEVDTESLIDQGSGALGGQASTGSAPSTGSRGPRRDGSGNSVGYGRAGSGGWAGALRRAGRALSRGQSDRSAAPTGQICTICLEEYEAGEVLRRLPCLHMFHQPCIDAWMDSNHTCPICRLDLISLPASIPGATAAAVASLPLLDIVPLVPAPMRTTS